jgi:sodium-dependent dicarboxylate transporter 2/3/5
LKSIKTFGLFLGPSLFLLVLLVPPFDSFNSTAVHLIGESGSTVDVTLIAYSMKVVFALLLLMVVWWLTEAVPLPVTALLPAVILPWFQISGVEDGIIGDMTFRSVLVNYANPVIFLFLGGFLIAAAMQKWRLDKRITYWLLSRGKLAGDARTMLLALMCLTAFISMWISNTATAAMMFPVGLGIVTQAGVKPGESNFGTAVMLGIAWAASIGGIGTIIGTPPNGIALGILNSTVGISAEEHISFLDWLTFGIPCVVLFVPVAWKILTLVYPPEMGLLARGKEHFQQERRSLGAPSRGERCTTGVFLLAVVLWVSRPFWEHVVPSPMAESLGGVDEYLIGLFAGVLLFVLPVNPGRGEFVLEWKDAQHIDWGTLLLFGGGIALSDVMFRTGLALWIAESTIGFMGMPSTLLLIVAVVFIVVVLSEVASNTAVAAMMVPILISFGLSSGISPTTLAVATAVASSMGFMLPVATPPNALVFSSGYIALKDMMRAGVILDLIGWLVTVAVLWLFGGVVFGVLVF